MTLLVLSYSTSWCQNDSIPSTGVGESDSVLVAISAIKVANAKMIELKYEKEINRNLRDYIQNDSVLISALSTNLSSCEINSNNKIAEIKKQRNTAIIAGSATSLLLLILLAIL